MKLDAAGDGQFELPAADPRAAQIAMLRRARVSDMVAGRQTALGEIIIQKRERRISPAGVTALAVSGPDLLAELADRTVGEVGLYQDDVHHALFAAIGLLLPIGDLVEAVDNDPQTAQNIELLPDWLWIGDSETFDMVRWRLQRSAVGGHDLTVEYWDGLAWASLTIEDGTTANERTLQRSGDMTFTPPGDWAASTINGRAAYWMRMQARDAQIGAYVADLSVVKRNPTGDALQMLMAYAPAGWSLDTVNGYPSTAGAVLMTGAGESVLEMLIAVAEATNEHFRLGAGRQIVWLRQELSDSGLRAIRAPDGPLPDADDVTCLITNLTQTNDASQIINRIYSHGAGDVTLSNTSRTAANLPAGWTFNKAENWIENTPSVNSLGLRRERWWTASVIRALNSSQAQAASNALFDAAVAALRLHSETATTYRADVVRVNRDLPVGQTIRVQYDEWIDDYHATEIDDRFVIIGVTRQINDAGVQIVGLEISSAGRRTTTGADLVMGALEQLRRLAQSERRLTQATTGLLSDGQAEAVLRVVEVRDPVNRAILRASQDDELVVIGPSTRQGWRYDANGHQAAPDILTVRQSAGFFGAAPVGRQAVVGSRGGNAALAALLTALEALGLIEDNTTS